MVGVWWLKPRWLERWWWRQEREERQVASQGKSGGKLPQWADGWDRHACQRRQPGDRLVIGPSCTQAKAYRSKERSKRKGQRFRQGKHQQIFKTEWWPSWVMEVSDNKDNQTIRPKGERFKLQDAKGLWQSRVRLILHRMICWEGDARATRETKRDWQWY